MANHAPDPRVAPSEPSLAEESRALELVQGALGRNDAAVALELLGSQDVAFASGRLAQERAAARVFALCALGRATELERARGRFLARYPGSPLSKRVLASCPR